MFMVEKIEFDPSVAGVQAGPYVPPPPIVIGKDVAVTGKAVVANGLAV
jgi:hypothetical protein